MLGSLLPGLRDLRAPFVSGILVLLSIVLFARGTVSAATGPDGTSQALDDLISWIGRPGVAAAASLTAYLIGSLVVSLTRGAVRGINHRAINRLAAAEKTEALVALEEGRATLEPATSVDELGATARSADEHRDRTTEEVGTTFSLALPKFTLVQKSHPGWPTRPSMWDRLAPRFPFGYDSVHKLDSRLRKVHYAWTPEQGPAIPAEVLREAFTSGARRLRLASPDLHSEFDRLLSEAELRDGMLLPLPIAALSLLMNVGLGRGTEVLLGATVVALAVVLYGQARRNDREAFNLLIGALADKTFSVASLDDARWTTATA